MYESLDPDQDSDPDEVAPLFKGRQGRSRESRIRAIENQREIEALGFKEEALNKCENKECELTNGLVEDEHSGDLVCTYCGVVQTIQGGLGFSSSILLKSVLSRPYLRPVHFRQRLAQLLCRDPSLPVRVLVAIKDELHNNRWKYRGSEKSYGKTTFSTVLHNLNLDRKQAKHWIQIRFRLDFPNPHPIIKYTCLKRLSARFAVISQCFQMSLFSKGPSPSCSYAHLKRRNILHLNYVAAQLWRLEDYEKEVDAKKEFPVVAPFLPQLSSDKQPHTNNCRWKVLIELAAKNFSIWSCPQTEEKFEFKWVFIPLTIHDIVLHFTGFY